MKRYIKKSWYVVLLLAVCLFVLSLAGCALSGGAQADENISANLAADQAAETDTAVIDEQPTNTATITPTESHTDTPSAVPTENPTDTPSPVPTENPTDTPSPTPTATDEPAEEPQTMTITLLDGETVEVPIDAQYCGSKKSEVYHYINCNSVSTIKKSNFVLYSSKEDAENRGKRPCKRCNP